MQLKYAQDARYTKSLMRKDRRVNLRVNKQDIEAIQEKAAVNGMPYQTLIATILHQVATGKMAIML